MATTTDFKIGDRVRYVKHIFNRENGEPSNNTNMKLMNICGTIKKVNDIYAFVEWDIELSEAHSCGDTCNPSKGWSVKREQIILSYPEEDSDGNYW
jgi:hypothetical protein